MSAHTEPVIQNLAEVQPQTVRWLWEDRVPFGKVTIFAGDPGLGKSFVALSLVAQVTRQGRDAVVLSAEDDAADTIRPRLDAAGADCKRVHLLQAVRVTGTDGKQSERMVRLDRDIAQIAEAIRLHPETTLVIIDPLSAYMGDVDSRNDEDVRSVLAPLAALASKSSVAIVGVKHLNKAEEKSAIYRAGGSIGFVAAARVVWLFTKDGKDPDRRLMLLVKSNVSRDPGGMGYRIVETESGLQVVWDREPVHINVDDALHTSIACRESAVDAAKDWLREFLKDGEKSATEVEESAKTAGHSWATVRRAADALNVERVREGFGPEGHWKWSLP